MVFSLSKSIMPMSVLRSDPEKVKRHLKESPVVITNKGTPDFGVCDLETLEIAIKVKELRNLLKKRGESEDWLDAEDVFKKLNAKYGSDSR